MNAVAEMCRSKMLVKHAIERGHQFDGDRRVEYFKGDKLVTFLLGGDDTTKNTNTEKKRNKRRAYEASSVDEARTVAQSLLHGGFIHRAKRVQKGILEVDKSVQHNKWESNGYYVWDFEGSKGLSHFLTGLLIVGMLTVTAFPIWPHFLKVYLWYCSVTLLIFMVVFLSLRAILFMDFWIIGYDFWIFPNLFDESLSVIDSFKPTYSFENGAPGQRYYRFALVTSLISFAIYCYNQPTDFDTFLAAQRDFVSDLYEGKLISDTSQQARDDIDKIKRPSFEELAQEEARAEEEAKVKENIQDLHRQALDPEYKKMLEEDPDLDDQAAQDMIDRMLADEEEED
uniref:Translocation protein SEC62 n=1 Tax=Aureoumbra lagunensis TaxID=44058 RepID=A0A6S8BIM4_9STRA